VKPLLALLSPPSASRRRRWVRPSAISGAAWTRSRTWRGMGWWTWRWGLTGRPCCCG